MHDRQIQNGIPILQTTGLGRGIQYVRFVYKENELVLKIIVLIAFYQLIQQLNLNQSQNKFTHHLQDVEEIKMKLLGELKMDQ